MSEREIGVVGTGSEGPSICRLAPFLVLVAGLIAFFALDLQHYATPESLKQHRAELQDWVAAWGKWAVIVFGAVYAVVTAFSIPVGAVLTIAGGFLFGPFLATLAVVIGATTGATAIFVAARYAFADMLRARAGPALRKIEQGFNEDGMSYMFILRLVPIFPFALVNLAPAFLGVPLRTYVISTFFGIIPGTLVYALVGDGAGAVFDRGDKLDLGIVFEPRVLAPIVGLALLACIPIAYKRLRARRKRGRDRHRG